MTIWLVSREYAGIAEAGGVKNVACSLCENLVRLGQKVMLFIPKYCCSDLSKLQSYKENFVRSSYISVCGKTEEIKYDYGMLNGVEIIFISHPAFSEKKGVYTYTKEEEESNTTHKRGLGHKDSLFLNVLFQMAVVKFSEQSSPEESPDIIHCQDATTALVPVFVEDFLQKSMIAKIVFSHTKCIVTIHNAGPGYHHEFTDIEQAKYYTSLPKKILEKGLCGTSVEPFLLSTLNAKLTTVSPEYAEEILNGTTETAGLSEAFRFRHINILGITNGIDFEKYDPSDVKKSTLPFAFNPIKKQLVGKYECRRAFLERFSIANKNNNSLENIEQFGYIETGLASDPCEPVFVAYHGRIVRQKGIDVLVEAADILLKKDSPVRFIIMGQGEPELENKISLLSIKYPGKCIFFKGYDKSLTRLCTAVSDFIALPSNFEPCGLEDFIAQIFGTLPVAHATGGLCKIVDDQTGFLYKPNTAEELSKTISNLVKLKQADSDIFNNMISYAADYVRSNYSWRIVTKEKYLEMYKSLLSKG